MEKLIGGHVQTLGWVWTEESKWDVGLRSTFLNQIQAGLGSVSCCQQQLPSMVAVVLAEDTGV